MKPPTVEPEHPVVAKPEHQEPQKQNAVVDHKTPQQEALRRLDGHSAFSMTANDAVERPHVHASGADLSRPAPTDGWMTHSDLSLWALRRRLVKIPKPECADRSRNCQQESTRSRLRYC